MGLDQTVTGVYSAGLLITLTDSLSINAYNSTDNARIAISSY